MQYILILWSIKCMYFLRLHFLFRFVALKELKGADAPGTVAAVKSAVEEDCERKDWKERLVGLSADGAAVDMGIRSGAAKRLRDEVPHLVSVHCCAHRVELSITLVRTLAFLSHLKKPCTVFTKCAIGLPCVAVG